MSAETHIDSLRQKHVLLEQQLETEYQRPMPDSSIIQDIKRRKLRIKEELNRLVLHS